MTVVAIIMHRGCRGWDEVVGLIASCRRAIGVGCVLPPTRPWEHDAQNGRSVA